MSIDYSALAQPKPTRSGKPRKHDQPDVYARVNERDKGVCRVCFVWTGDDAHRHHLIYRSRGGETITSNVLTLCRRCHENEHAHIIRLTGNADTVNSVGQLCGVTYEEQRQGVWAVKGHR